MKALATAAAAAIAVCFPFAAFAQSAPPPPPLVDVPPPPPPLVDLPLQAPVVANVVTTESAPESPLDLDGYPSARRDEIWERYARRNVVSVNVLYPVSGAIVLGFTSSLSASSGGLPLGAFSIPVELERSMTRSWSVFGVVQPAVANRGSTSFSCAAGAGTRLYFAGNAPQGIWTGLEVDHVLGSRDVTARAEIGTNTVFDSGLTVSFGAGLGVTWAGDVVGGFTGMGVMQPAAGLRFSIGYSFV